MALPADFSKIFGSTATGGLTPIGDVNYAKGWEFVGSNPPTKNDFSYLQNLSDLKSQWLYSNKLQRTDPFGDIKADGAAAISTALENLGLGDDARLSGNLTVKGGVWDTAPGNTPERVWSPNNKPSLSELGVLDATTTQKGIVELATNAEMATGTSSSLVPSVAAVMSLFSKRSFTANDYVRIPDVPGGLIIQWVRGNASASGTFFAQMPIPFPNKLLFAGAFEAGVSAWGTDSATTWGIDFANSSLSQVIAYSRRIFPTTVTQESAAGLVIAIGN